MKSNCNRLEKSREENCGMDFHSQRGVRLGLNSDIISNLPDSIVERILMCLPIRDAVRTSVLSRSWRYKYAYIPEIRVTDYCIRSFLHKEDKIVNFIDRVLLLHRGPIKRFELVTEYLNGCSSIDRWLSVLSRSGIKELVLKFQYRWLDEHYAIPFSLFSLQYLCTLELTHCIFQPPFSFKGFTNLKCLALNDIEFDNGVLNQLISSCPLLETLKLANPIDPTPLRICAPNLQYLDVYSSFEDIYFENTPLLSVVKICLESSEDKCDYHSETTNLATVLSYFPRIREFEADGLFLQFLRMGDIPEKLPSTFDTLQKLSLSVNFEDADDIYVTVCLLNSCPNVQELKIWNHSDHYDTIERPGSGKECTKYLLDLQSQTESSMKHILKVDVNHVVGYNSELNFIKYVLLKSSMLETLSIVGYEELVMPESEILKALLRFPRASAKAEIHWYQTPSDDPDYELPMRYR